MKLQLAHFNSLISLANHFNSDKRCRDFITEQRWGGHVTCPFCGCTHTYVCSNGDKQFKCAVCKKRFSCLVGTIFIIPSCHFRSGLWQCTLSHQKGEVHSKSFVFPQYRIVHIGITSIFSMSSSGIEVKKL